MNIYHVIPAVFDKLNHTTFFGNLRKGCSRHETLKYISLPQIKTESRKHIDVLDGTKYVPSPE